MPAGKNNLYYVLAAACLGGYVWLYLNLSIPDAVSDPGVGLCPMKRLTDVPCPSCGSTRSVVSLLQGHVAEALYWNPLGAVLALGLVILPGWIAYDSFKKERTLADFYEKTEAFLKQKTVAATFVVLILLNWIWNILKHV